MAFHPLLATGNHEVILSGSFAPAGTGAPTDVYGTGYTVVRTSAGLFTLTLTDRFIRLRAGLCQLQLATLDTWFAQLGSIDVATNGTVQIRVIDETATVTDVAADANNRVHFCLFLSRDSSVAA